MSSCLDQTSLPATFLFYYKKPQVPKLSSQDKFHTMGPGTAVFSQAF